MFPWLLHAFINMVMKGTRKGVVKRTVDKTGIRISKGERD